jgi:hypothetical protein
MAAGARARAGLRIGDSHGGEVTLVLGLVQQDTSLAIPHARRRTSGRATAPAVNHKGPSMTETQRKPLWNKGRKWTEEKRARRKASGPFASF